MFSDNIRNHIRVALDASCAMESPMTGVGYAALYLLRALCRGRYDLDLRMFGTPDRVSANALAELRPHCSRWSVFRNARQLKYTLWPALNWPPIEWFCGTVDIAHNLFHQLPATRRARRVVTIHDLSFLRMPEVHTPRTVQKQTRLIRHCARYADAIIAVSNFCRDEIVDVLGVSAHQVHAVPNAVDHAEFNAPLDQAALSALKQGLGVARDYFICLGTLEPRKNLPRLLRAYNQLRQRNSRCPQLLLVGKRGWLVDPIFETLDGLRLQGDVIHAGHLTRPKTVMLLRGAIACVYPSLYEGFGLPALEAMAAGTPLVCSDIGALREVAADTALLAAPEDESALAHAMESVIADSAATQSRAEKARARAQTFTWEKSADTLAHVYRTLA